MNSVAFDEHILKSRRALAAWQWMSTISTRPDEVVRLLHTEARQLTVMAMEHPEKAASVIQLIEAYKRLATTVQQRRRPRMAPRPPVAPRISESSLDIC